jgi:3-hydroxybutyrate dehydrogenase
MSDTLERPLIAAADTRPLAGRTALVTGSTSGIGLGIAEAFAGQGAAIMLNGFGDAESVMRTRDRLAGEFGVEVVYSGADLSDPAAIGEMMAYARDVLGPVDILVNNAGIQHVAPIAEFPVAKWDAIMAINLSSAFHTIRSVLPEMVERRFGRIINVASAHGLVASPFKSAYVAAKHGVIGLTKTAALEYADANIRVNAVCPGFIKTQMTADTMRRRGEAIISQIPFRRMGEPGEIAEMVVWLCSERASYVSGASYNVDGGWMAI